MVIIKVTFMRVTGAMIKEMVKAQEFILMAASI